MLIMGTAFVAILIAAGESSRGAVVARDYEVARSLLNRLSFEEPLQLDKVDGDDSESGSFDGSKYRKYSWKRTVTQIGEESDDLYRVETQILWEHNKDTWSEGIQEYLHLPSARRNGWIDENAE